VRKEPTTFSSTNSKCNKSKIKWKKKLKDVGIADEQCGKICRVGL